MVPVADLAVGGDDVARVQFRFGLAVAILSITSPTVELAALARGAGIP